MVGHKFTNEEIEWIKEKYLSTLETCEQIASKFNEKFDTSDYKVTKWAISDLMTKRLKIKRGTNKGRFGQGLNEKKHADIGSIMPCVQFGKNVWYTRIKIRCDNKICYVPYHKYLYEQAYGKLKDDEFVIFADGNTQNFDLENIIKVNRKISSTLARKDLFKKGKITKAFVECENLEETINRLEES